MLKLVKLNKSTWSSGEWFSGKNDHDPWLVELSSCELHTSYLILLPLSRGNGNSDSLVVRSLPMQNGGASFGYFGVFDVKIDATTKGLNNKGYLYICCKSDSFGRPLPWSCERHSVFWIACAAAQLPSPKTSESIRNEAVQTIISLVGFMGQQDGKRYCHAGPITLGAGMCNFSSDLSD